MRTRRVGEVGMGVTQKVHGRLMVSLFFGIYIYIY